MQNELILVTTRDTYPDDFCPDPSFSNGPASDPDLELCKFESNIVFKVLKCYIFLRFSIELKGGAWHRFLQVQYSMYGTFFKP
jgi:hypothetical protein